MPYKSIKTVAKSKRNKASNNNRKDHGEVNNNDTIGAVAIMSQIANVQAASAIDLGNCTSFAIMGGTAVNFDGATSTVAEGNVGVSPGTSIM